MKISIARTRWIIIRKSYSRTEVLCGHANDAKFLPLDNVGDSIVRTYRSYNVAVHIIERYWTGYDNATYEPVEVKESISTWGDLY